MSSTRTALAVFFTVICELVLLTIALVGHWPAWSYFALAMVAGAGILVVKATGRQPNPLPVELVPHLPMLPVERLEERVTRVSLPSSWDDYDFVFSATVRWCRTGESVGEPIVNPAGLAVEAILERARGVTEKREPGRASLVQHELNGVLGRMQPDATGYLQAMAEAVALTLTDHDRERLDKLAAVRKDKAVWEHERKYEQSRREYLGEDVLKDTGSAVVWWLARNEDRVEKAVQDIGLLAQLSSAAHNTEVPELFQHLVPPPFRLPAPVRGPSDDSEPVGLPPDAMDHFDAFLRMLDLPEDDPQRALLARQVAGIVGTYGQAGAARQLIDRFDRPTDSMPEESPDPADPDGEPTEGGVAAI